MGDNKRKAEGPLDGRGRKTRPRADAEQKPTIETLEPWPLTINVEELTTDLLPVAFRGLSRGRQYVDLWTILAATYTDRDVAVLGAWTRIKGVTVEKTLE